MPSEAFITPACDTETAALDVLFSSDITVIKSAAPPFQNANRKKPSVIVTENISGYTFSQTIMLRGKKKNFIQTYEHCIYSFLRKLN